MVDAHEIFDSLYRRSSMLFTAGFRMSISSLGFRIRKLIGFVSIWSRHIHCIPFDSSSGRSSSLFTSGVSVVFGIASRGLGKGGSEDGILDIQEVDGSM